MEMRKWSVRKTRNSIAVMFVIHYCVHCTVYRSSTCILIVPVLDMESNAIYLLNVYRGPRGPDSQASHQAPPGAKRSIRSCFSLEVKLVIMQIFDQLWP